MTENGGKGTAWEADHWKWQIKHSKLDISLKYNSGIYSEPGTRFDVTGKTSEYLDEKHTEGELATGIVLENVNVCENQQGSSTLLEGNLIMSPAVSGPHSVIRIQSCQ